MMLDVFGRMMQAVRTDRGWTLFLVGSEGKKRPVQEPVPPAELSDDELLSYFDDLYHEWASPAHPSVQRLP